MSAETFPKKSIPLCLSLGITSVLEQGKLLDDPVLTDLTPEEQKLLVLNDKSLALICKNYQPKKRSLNPTLVSLAVRRILALRKHSPFPVFIVVKSKKDGEALLKELTKHATSCKLYNMIYNLKDEIDKDFISQNHTTADFILLTYKKLRDLVVNKVCPTTEQIVFLNPLTKYRCQDEVIDLDVIIGGLHRHKCRRPQFSFLLDSAQFPVLTQEEYKYLLKVEDCLFFRCQEGQRTQNNNPFRDSLPNLSDEHYQFFIFGELFRGRKSSADLRRKIQETITYKLHLFSNNIYPELARNNEDFKNKMEKRKIKIDKRVQIKLNQILNLFTKGVSHTIYGHTQSNSIKTTFSWQEPAESAPFLPLVEKKKDSKYYLTGLGEAVLVATSNIAGIELGFSSFLNKLADCLFKRNKASTKLSLEEIIRFYCLLVGLENVDFPVLQEQSEQKDLDSFVNDSFDVYDQFIEREFGFLIKDYASYASIQLLSAFEKLMETNAFLFFQRMKNYKKNKKRTWEEKRSEAILKSAGYEPVTVKQTGLKFHLDFQKTKKELENFKEEGLLTSLKTFDNSGSSELKYGTPELFTKFHI